MRWLVCVTAAVAGLSASVASAAPVVERVSVSSRGEQGNAESSTPLVTRDGRHVIFQSAADNLTRRDHNQRADIFMRDRFTGSIVRVARRVLVGPFLLGGSLLAYVRASDDGQDLVLVRDLATRQQTQLNIGGRGRTVDVDPEPPFAVSSQARHFAFVYRNAVVYVRDRIAGKTVRVGRGASPAISADGRFVTFESLEATLVPGDDNGAADVFLRDMQTGALTKVSRAVGGGGADADSRMPSISADGALIAFTSEATNLVAGDTNGNSDVFVYDRRTRSTTCVSVGPLGEQANGYSGRSAFIGPRVLRFSSGASNLVPGDLRPLAYVRDLATGRTVRSSVEAFSPEGRWAAFASDVADLVPGDTNRRADVFLLGPLARPWVLPAGGP